MDSFSHSGLVNFLFTVQFIDPFFLVSLADTGFRVDPWPRAPVKKQGGSPDKMISLQVLLLGHRPLYHHHFNAMTESWWCLFHHTTTITTVSSHHTTTA